jgi:hypothetical protein
MLFRNLGLFRRGDLCGLLSFYRHETKPLFRFNSPLDESAVADDSRGDSLVTHHSPAVAERRLVTCHFLIASQQPTFNSQLFCRQCFRLFYDVRPNEMTSSFDRKFNANSAQL